MGQAILARAEAQGTPLIEGELAMFIWRGRSAPALVGDFNGWGAQAGPRLEQAAPGAWTAQIRLPEGAYIEYAYLDEQGERLLDSFNQRRVPNGMGAHNHYFYMPGGEPTPLARRARGAPRGQVTRHTLSVERFVAGGRRQVHLYQPPVQGPVPLLVVWDGLEYARLAKLTTIVDNMIAQGRIRPLALALVQHGGAARLIEYACSDATLGFLQAHVLPLAAQHLGLVDLAAEPGAYGIMGASMGGLMALYSALRLPQVFGAALSQSGAFDLSTGDTVIYTLARLLEPSGLKVWMDVGQYDIPRLVPANERMARLLSERGYALTFRKYPAGHNFTAWRDELWRGLEALFGRSPGQAPG